jgi:hypothetical protein
MGEHKHGEGERGILKKTILAFAALASFTGLYAQEPQGSVQLEATIPLPEVKGSFDHFAADVKGNRLFLASEDHIACRGLRPCFREAPGQH